MAWQDAYSAGDQVDVKVGGDWYPATVDPRDLAMPLTCTLRVNGATVVVGTANMIRKPSRAAAPASPAQPAAKPAKPPARPAAKDNKGPPA
jgi:hypothetical protein